MPKTNATILLILFTLFSIITQRECGFIPRKEHEMRQKIAVIDSGINIDEKILPFLCKTHHRTYVGKPALKDDAIHGTIVANIITQNLDPNKYCIISYRVFSGEEGSLFVISAIKDAIKDEVSYINLSLSAIEEGFLADIIEKIEGIVYRSAIKHGIKISVAAGNEGLNLNDKCVAFPACHKLDRKYFHVVSNTDWYANKADFAYYDKSVFQYKNLIVLGTSFSSPSHLNKWIRGLIK